MGKFYVGQRVRKVRGMSVGLTGVIMQIDPTIWSGHHLYIRADRPAPTRSSIADEDMGWNYEAWGHPDDWEPVTPPHEACEPEFKAQMDELLLRQGVEA